MAKLAELAADDPWWPPVAQKLEEHLTQKGPQTFAELKAWAMRQGDAVEARLFDLCSWTITNGNAERVARAAALPVLCIKGTLIEDRKPDAPGATPAAREWNRPPAEAIAKEKASRESVIVAPAAAAPPARLNAIRDRAARTTTKPAAAAPARPADRAVVETKSAGDAVETALADARRKVAPIAAETLAAHGVLPVRRPKSPATPPPAAPTTKENDMANDWISAEAAAEIIGVSKRYLLDRLSGEAALKRQGGGKGGPPVEFSRASVEKFAAKRSAGGEEAKPTKAAKRPKNSDATVNSDLLRKPKLEAAVEWLVHGYNRSFISADELAQKLARLANDET